MYGISDEPLLNLSLKNVAVKDALWEIEKQSRWFSCIMLMTWVKAGKISMEIKSVKPVQEALDICLKRFGFE